MNDEQLLQRLQYHSDVLTSQDYAEKEDVNFFDDILIIGLKTNSFGIKEIYHIHKGCHLALERAAQRWVSLQEYEDLPPDNDIEY